MNDGEGSCNCVIHDKNEWRRTFLYNKEIDEVLGEQLATLKAIFSCFQGTQLRKRKKNQLPYKNYMRMLKHLEFFDSDFTQREAKLCCT